MCRVWWRYPYQTGVGVGVATAIADNKCVNQADTHLVPQPGAGKEILLMSEGYSVPHVML